jgi:uncharacterized SAM-binding protein YcdF (DUF218 family)
MQGALTGLLLPPLLLVLLVLAAGLLAWRGRRAMGALAALSAVLLLLLATPFVSSSLAVAVSRLAPDDTASAPTAIIVLGGEMVRGEAGVEVGPLTLERLRAGAALHRRTGLPLLVTGGPALPGAPPIATLMAASLREDFGVPVRWAEELARDTRDNAVLSAAMLRAEGIGAAHLVTHAWHLPRAQQAFARAGFAVAAAPVRREAPPRGTAGDWLPRPDHLARSWFMLREAAGLVVYRIRDGN